VWDKWLTGDAEIKGGTSSMPNPPGNCQQKKKSA